MPDGGKSHRAANPAGLRTTLGGKGSMEGTAKRSKTGMIPPSPSRTFPEGADIFLHLASASHPSQCLRPFRERKGLSFRKVGLDAITITWTRAENMHYDDRAGKVYEITNGATATLVRAFR